MSAKNLVDAIIAGDSVGIENSFDSAVLEKISDALDDYRIAIAHNMFGAKYQADDVTEE